MSVLTCYVCHMGHQIVMTTMNLVALMINRSNINPKTFGQYDHQITESQCTEEELNLPGCDKQNENKVQLAKYVQRSKSICYILCNLSDKKPKKGQTSST